MIDKDKTKKQLIDELEELRHRLANLEPSEINLQNIEEELKNSKRGYKDIVEKANIAILIDDDEGNFKYFNKKFAELFGYSMQEMEKQSIQSLVHPDDLKMVMEYHKGRISGKKLPSKYEFRGTRKDGNIIYLEVDTVKVKEGGKVVGTRSYINHITERKRAEKIQRILFNISQATSVSRNLDELLKIIHQQLGSLIDTTNFYIALYDEKNDIYTFPYHVDQYDDNFSPQPLKKSLTDYVRRTGEALLANEIIHKQLKNKKEVELIGPDSPIWLGSPLKTAMGIIGVVVVQSYTDSTLYSHKDLELLSFVSEHIAMAIERKRNEEALQKSKEELEIKVKQRTSELEKLNKKLQKELTERKRTEQALQKSEQRYRAIFENAQLGIYITTPEGTYKTVNQALVKIHCYNSPEEMMTADIEKDIYVCTKDMEKFRDELNQKGFINNYEINYRRKDGKIITCLETAIAIQDEKGKVIEYQGTIADISKRKRLEEELREINERLNTLIDAIPDIIYFKDAQYRNLAVNKAFEKLAGLQKEKILGKTDDQLLPSDLAKQCRDSDKKTIKRSKLTRFEEQTTDKNGNKIFFDTIKVPLFDDQGNIKGLIGVARDITHRKKAEEAYRTLIEHSLQGFVILQDYHLVFANPAISKISGYSIEEILSLSTKDMKSIIHTEDRKQLWKNVQNCLSGKPALLRHEFRFLRKDGVIRWLEILVNRIEYQGKPALQVACIDITERKKFEEELIKSDKLESVAILAGGIAHDFNNILAATLGNISLAKMNTDSEDKIFEILLEAEKACLRAKSLTHQLLTFSRVGAPIKKIISIAELIADCAKFALKSSNVKCKSFIDKNLWPVEVDEGQIVQVINNLVINADQAMPEGGTIKLSAENITLDEEKPESLLTLKEGEYVRISIEDQGIGISEEQLPKIFDPYFTTKQKGSGLGLATAYSIIKSHDGYITAESKLGVGTTFYIYLPASQKEIPKKKDLKEKPLEGKGKILLMDDEEVIRELYSRLLTHLGYQVEFAKDGAEAIEQYRKAKDSGDLFDAIILDLTIPGGIGGKEVVKKLLEIDPEVKAIATSNYPTDPIMANYKKYGFKGIITKPFKLEQLSELLYKVIIGRIT